MSRAAVVDLAVERDMREARRGPFIAVFSENINDLHDRMHFSTCEWRILNYAITQCNYGQSLGFDGARLGRRLGISSSTICRVMKRFRQAGIFYEHTHSLYLSAYIAYKGKLNALAKVRQWEDLIKAAHGRGETLDVDLGEEHYYAGGQEIEDESPTLPTWLEDA